MKSKVLALLTYCKILLWIQGTLLERVCLKRGSVSSEGDSLRRMEYRP